MYFLKVIFSDRLWAAYHHLYDDTTGKFKGSSRIKYNYNLLITLNEVVIIGTPGRLQILVTGMGLSNQYLQVNLKRDNSNVYPFALMHF
jgi:hypothetical protein